MPSPLPFHRSALRTTAAAMIAFTAACGGDERTSEMDVPASEVDQEASAEITEREQSSFTPPADSALTPGQVNAYLRASLLQFDLVRKEGPGLHARAQEIEKRGENAGIVAGLRNVAAAGSLVTDYADLITGSYVRSSRTLGYNPAEMEWVRERMTEVSGYLMTRPMQEAMIQNARQTREQVEQYRGQPGFSDEQIAEMVKNAEQMERDARAELENAGGAAGRNVEVLRRTRPNVTDQMWTAVALVGGGSGLAGLSASLANPADSTAQRQLTEWRQLYTDALADRVTPGMEPSKAAGVPQ